MTLAQSVFVLNTVKIFLSVFVVLSYITIRLGIPVSNNYEKYVRLVNICYRIAIGLFLVVIQIPSIFRFFMSPHPLYTEISPLLMSAGILILSTVQKKEVLDVYEFVESSLKKISAV